MSAKSLDVFSLRDAVVGEYKNFATSFTTIRARVPAEPERSGEHDPRAARLALVASGRGDAAAVDPATGRPPAEAHLQLRRLVEPE